MKRWIKFSAAALLGIAACAAAALAVANQLGERKLHRRVAIEPESVALASDAASIERGRYLYMSRGCSDCHGATGTGKDVINDGKGLLIHAPNITTGSGSVVAGYRPVDWVRTIRHGVKPGGEPLMVMPSEDYNRLTDGDLAALVAFVRQLAPAEGRAAIVQLPTMVKALYGAGLMRDAAEKIDHTLAPSQPVAEGVTPEHGAYVANACIGCHGASLSGGKIPGTPPDWPPAANLTPAVDGAMARYPDANAFIAMLRTGKRPDGSAVSPVMPFEALKAMNDTDVAAIYLHLKRLPAVPTGERR
jgi:mono/diheme cytochrome c family protein